MRFLSCTRALRPRLKRLKFASRQGAIIVPAAILLIVVVALLALTIDTGFMSTVRTELQRSADSAALAGASSLIEKPRDTTKMARQYARSDACGGRQLNDNEVIVQTGRWDDLTRVFIPNGSPADAVRVTTFRNDVPTFFAFGLGNRQQRIESQAIATFEPRDIMLVLDVSGSMNDKMKIHSLKKAVKSFLKMIESISSIDRVGVATYSDKVELNQKLAHVEDYRNVNKLIDELEAEGWTNIGGGMAIARQELTVNGRPGVRPLMVLMTDGMANRPLNVDPIQFVRDEAQAAAKLKIPVFAISFGEDADKLLMEEVAKTTGSSYVHVDEWGSHSDDDLSEVFRKIAANRPLKLVD